MIRKAAIMVLFGVLAGCGKAPDKPRGTGAAETAKDYLQSLVRKDWPSAYARVADASKSRLSQEQFARLAQEYRRRFGFEPELVFVTACEEHGPEAIAHVTLAGKDSTRHRHKDAIVLHRGDAGWAVVPPADFGRAGRP